MGELQRRIALVHFGLLSERPGTERAPTIWSSRDTDWGELAPRLSSIRVIVDDLERVNYPSRARNLAAEAQYPESLSGISYDSL